MRILRNILGVIGGMIATVVIVAGLVVVIGLIGGFMSDKVEMYLAMGMLAVTLLVGLPIVGYDFAQMCGWIKRRGE